MSVKSLAFHYVLAILILAALCITPPATAQKIFTVAGGYIGDGKPATSAALNFPQFAAYDLQGNLLISETCRLRKVDKNGIISTIAGTGICGFSGDGGPATNAKVAMPTGLAVDPTGNIFFADSVNQRVRKIDRAGTITTIAGNGTATYCGDGQLAVKACLFDPQQVAIGNGPVGEVLYIADWLNQRIRQVVLGTDIITTVAGNGTRGYSGDGGPAKNASLNGPWGVAFYGETRSLWISDTANFAVRRVNLKTGIITTFLGNINGIPSGLVTDKSGNLHVAEVVAEQVDQITVPGENVSVDAGGTAGFNGDGIPANTAMLSSPYGVTVAPAGDLLTLDSGNARVRKGSGSQQITTLAGGYIGDGKAAISAALNTPQTVAFDKVGNVYIADMLNHRIRKVDASGKISTFAGNGISGYSGDGGPAQNASLYFPDGVATDAIGNVLIADFSNGAIRKVDSSGTISTFARDQAGPSLMTIDAAGTLYVAETAYCRISRFAPDGTSSVIAGVPAQCGFNSDGIPAMQAQLNYPYGVALDSKGNLYIGDSSNNRVRMVDTSGIIHTIAGNGTCGFSGDGGPAVSAMLCSPSGVAVDANGNLYIADWFNNRVRKVDAGGSIGTIAGTGSDLYNGDGLPARKTNILPFSVAVSPSGDVYVVDYANNRVRKIQ